MLAGAFDLQILFLNRRAMSGHLADDSLPNARLSFRVEVEIPAV
jgi:hypothetical protein